MSLKDQIQKDFILAMKARDEVKKVTLSMLKAAIMTWEVSGKEKKEAGDEDVLKIVQREVKQRKDAAEGFRSGGKTEMANQEEAEMSVLMKYMPEQMGEDEIRETVKQLLKKAGISSKADMGKAMWIIMAELKGKADGKMINQVVASLLE